jgi:hypothetical protein
MKALEIKEKILKCLYSDIMAEKKQQQRGRRMPEKGSKVDTGACG